MQVTKVSCIAVEVDWNIITRDECEELINKTSWEEKEYYEAILVEMDNLGVLTVDEWYDLQPIPCP